MEQQYKYKNGLPFSKGLDKALDGLHERIFRFKKASCILIDGGVGEGKTTLSIQVAEYFSKSKLIFKEQLSMGAVDFRNKIKLCFKNKFMVVIFDEAGEFDRRGAITRINKMLNRIFELYRAFQILVIITLPDFSQLDSKLFDNKIPRLLIHCYGKKERYGSYSVYSLRRMYYLRNWMTKLVVKNQAFTLTRPNLRGHFLDLEPDRSKELDKFTTAGKMDILEESELRDLKLKSMQDITATLGRSVVWVSNKMKDLKIRPERIYKRRKYYHEAVIDLLYEQMQRK